MHNSPGQMVVLQQSIKCMPKTLQNSTVGSLSVCSKYVICFIFGCNTYMFFCSFRILQPCYMCSIFFWFSFNDLNSQANTKVATCRCTVIFVISMMIGWLQQPHLFVGQFWKFLCIKTAALCPFFGSVLVN